MKRATKALMILAAAVTVFGLAGCGEKNEQEVEAVFAVNSYKVKESNLDDYLEFGGDVDAASSVAVMPDTAGKISRVMVNVGDRVTKGQILCYVDASRPGMIFVASPVRSPIAGTVTYFPGVIGTSVAQTSVIAKIANTTKLEITTAVPERFVSKISLKQKAQLTLSAYPGEKFSATVIEVSPVLDTSTRTMNIKLSVDDNDPRIKIGMFAKIHLVTEHKENVCVIPHGAIVKRNGENFVFKTKADGEDTRAVITPVVLGVRVDDVQEILEGVKAGDEIIIKGQSLLNDNSKIKVVSVVNND